MNSNLTHQLQLSAQKLCILEIIAKLAKPKIQLL